MVFLLFQLLNEADVLKAVIKKFCLEKEEVRIAPEDLNLYGYGKYRLKLFDTFIAHPFKLSPYMRSISRGIIEYADSLWALSYFPFARIDEMVRRGLVERPEKAIWDSIINLKEPDKELLKILKEFYKVPISSKELSHLPKDIKLPLHCILIQMKESMKWIEKAFKNIKPYELNNVMEALLEEGELSNREIDDLIRRIDFKYLAAGAQDLSFCLDKVLNEIGKLDSFPSITWDTKYGKIAIRGKEADLYNLPPYLLIIDGGGDDVYYFGGTSSTKNPISVTIDLSGSDKYKADSVGIAVGFGGYGIVIDKEGNDSYFTKKIGVGTGIFGLGILLDMDGDDSYSCDLYGEGAGLFGCGVLSDLKGNDIYKGFQGIQGFGFVKGAGILVDREGNDRYIARDDTIKYPSPQTRKHNVSLAQGAGFGIRADFKDGHSLAGGVGMLLDKEGNDSYSCGVFGQGVGYWFGVGFLLDYKGDDEYNGVWYVQGAGAHFAIGALIDSLGNDHYKATMNMAQGAGHDFTFGLLLDYEGDDYHDAPNLSLGSGNANGMGLFIDLSGNDVYKTHGGITLGRANIERKGGLRDYMQCIGIFVDAAGKDEYNQPFAKNGECWRQNPPKEPYLPTEKCIGCDF